jgi:hypothetical protein
MLKKSNNPKDFHVFSDVDKETADDLYDKIQIHLASFVDMYDIEGTIGFSHKILIDIIDRIEKRRVYFHIFYNGCEMGELNEGALLCFWIAKLQPFYNETMLTTDLNVLLAAHILRQTIYLHYDREKKEEREIPEHVIDSLVYALKYRDISKEALMLLMDSFLDEKQE